MFLLNLCVIQNIFILDVTDHLEAQQNAQHLQLHTQEHTVGQNIIDAPKIRNNFQYSIKMAIFLIVR